MSGAQGFSLIMYATSFIHQENPRQLGLLGVVIFKVFHRGYNRTVSTPIRHQNKSRDLRSQFFSLSHHMLVQSSNLPLDLKSVLGQRNEETKKLVTLHLINLRR